MRRSTDTLRSLLPRTRVGWLVCAAVAVHVLTAWFSGGYFHADEHWQILEFAWHRLGHEPATALPWEFEARIRPAFQPWLAAGVIVLLQRLGAFTPLAAAFLLRLASALLGLWVSLRVCALALPSIRRPAYREMAFFGALFLWCAPFLHARFSGESWGGLLAFGGLALLMAADASAGGGEDGAGRAPGPTAFALAAGAGLAFGFGVFCRLQMAPAAAGAALWWVCVRRGSWRLAGAAAAGFAAAVAANVVIDHWLYRAWVFTPWRDFAVNALEGKASGWGTSPWWMAGAPFLVMLLPPFSVVGVALLVAGAWTCRRHALTWMFVPFVVAHAVVPHKELRFMAPMIFAVAPLVALSFDRLPGRAARWLESPRAAGLRTVTRRSFVGLNAAALAVMTVVPPLPSYPLLDYVWHAGRTAPVRVVVFPDAAALHQLGDWHRLRFYWPPFPVDVEVRGGAAAVAALDAPPGTRVFVLHAGVEAPAVLTAAGIACPAVAGAPARSLAALGVFRRFADARVWTLCAPGGR